MKSTEEMQAECVGKMFDSATKHVAAQYREETGKDAPTMRVWAELSDEERRAIAGALASVPSKFVDVAVRG